MAQTVDTQTLDRLSIWIVLAIGFFVVVFSVYQIRTTLFDSERVASNRLAQALQEGNGITEEQDVQQILADQSRDDDGDGLNNFAETAQYGTSPYLVDSDSDGINDAEEIANGTDPTCAQGELCAVESEGGDGTVTEAEVALSSLTPTLSGDAEQPSRDEMEAALLQRGLTQEQLDQLTDQEVLDVYLEVAAVAARGADTITNVQELTEELVALPSEEKRALLLESGVTRDQVDQLSDADVDALVSDAVNTVLEQQGVVQAEDTPAQETDNADQQ